MEEMNIIICLKKRNSLTFFLFIVEKMVQEAAYFEQNGIIKSVFHKNKKANVNINKTDIKDIVLSHKKSYDKDSFKTFDGYRHKGNAFRPPLCLKLPQINAYAKYVDENSKLMNLLVNDKKILEKYSEIWYKIKTLIK